MPEGFRAKLQKLNYLSFQGHDRHDWLTLDLSDDELIAELKKFPDPELFLGRYSSEEIKERLKKHGILDRLKELGYPEVEVELRTDEVFTHRLYVFVEKRDYEHILIELRLREGIFQPREQFLPGVELGPLPMILVDWFLLQNPKKAFQGDLQALPQQRYPGLGLLRDMIPLILETARETDRAGVLDAPEHYHGALFYSRWFRFFNPTMEGKFLAMQRDLTGQPLHLISSAIGWDCLVNLAAGRHETWRPGEQILPLRQDLLDYFNHPRYLEQRDEAFLGNRYQLDLARYETKLAEAKKEEGAGADARPGLIVQSGEINTRDERS